MTVANIVEKYLKENGYDGLCNGNLECGCFVRYRIEYGELKAAKIGKGYRIEPYDLLVFLDKTGF